MIRLIRFIACVLELHRTDIFTAWCKDEDGDRMALVCEECKRCGYFKVLSSVRRNQCP